MRIEQIDKQTIKVILTPNDMEDLDITYEEMDYKDPNTKRVIFRTSASDKEETTIDLNRGKLFIEAFPYADGGCVLYICTIGLEGQPNNQTNQKRSGFNTPLVFEFPDIDLLAAACSHLLLQYNHIILKSALYLYEKKNIGS